ncbi:uncharacterized protein BO97DRAFT_11530 [Aspergillus homomorphus CBS 101889]|uniref:TLDc domain-containing protein n=1 Tax=Aspergillus homomorphus (strain CBS 101889) TaxID=1450537 RepID=A0A395IC70_ASPHC|nr:hypothetical protein BO97DRAFT_11530 [Aspergillus homomorphus CBS 101889]RAL17646.1 hypothetical protein BO97DRAFT_11530 [Aspergillus homomorphus CBS 101889]
MPSTLHPSRTKINNDASLVAHIARNHPDFSFSSEGIDLLWRCLYYYAYHPFPRNETTEERIDCNAFNRTLALLVHDGTKLLGTQDNGAYLWRSHEDPKFIPQANFARVLRSIGRPDTSSPTSPGRHDSPSVLSDVMDVLATTQPCSISQAPSVDQLDTTARKLLSQEPPTPTRYRVSRQEVLLLATLVLRLRTSKAKWDQTRQFGSLAPFEPADEVLATGILQRIMPEDKEHDADELASTLFEHLPHLLLHFHQLWAVLFQPSRPNTNNVSVADATENSIPARVLSALSLFLPMGSSTTTTPRSSSNPRRVRFEKIDLPADSAPTYTDLVNALQTGDNPHIILATNADRSQVIGALIPSPLWSTGADGRKRDCKVGNTHLLFQLGEEFRVLRWMNKPHTLLKTLIGMNGEEQSDAQKEPWTGPFYVGDMSKSSAARLEFDPEEKVVSLRGSTGIADGSSDAAGYRDVLGSPKGPAARRDWEVVINASRVYVYSVLA